MREITENPALALRQALLSLRPCGFLRWDRSGRSLLVSDAPRRSGGETLVRAAEAMALRAWIEDDLMWIDLPQTSYAELLSMDFLRAGDWTDAWFAEQALLRGILRKGPDGAKADTPLLRAAMLACVQGDIYVHSFATALRAAHAAALRLGDTASCRACAALLAYWLWTEKQVGIPI